MLLLSFSFVHVDLHSFPTRRSSDLHRGRAPAGDRVRAGNHALHLGVHHLPADDGGLPVLREAAERGGGRSEEHTSELQSPCNIVFRLLLEKKKNKLSKYLYQYNYQI